MDSTNSNNTWRSGVAPDSRQKVVQRIMDTLQRHMPPAGQENMEELLKIAYLFEEKIFQAATDEQDYLRKISLKTLSLETKAQAAPGPGTQARLGNPSGVVKSLDPDWRSGVAQDSRQKIVKRIMETLQRHMPPAGQESMGELLKIAYLFEEKTFQAATDEQDYLRKISLKMLSLETKAQATPPGPGIQARLGSPSGVVKSLDPGPALLMQSQQNPVHLTGTVPGQIQQRQQLLAQTLQNNLNATALQSSTGMGSSPSSVPFTAAATDPEFDDKVALEIVNASLECLLISQEKERL